MLIFLQGLEKEDSVQLNIGYTTRSRCLSDLSTECHRHEVDKSLRQPRCVPNLYYFLSPPGPPHHQEDLHNDTDYSLAVG